MAFQLREVELPILPKGSPELRVLHFSDLHLTPRREREIADIRSWADLTPDLVVSTGDFLGHKDAINTALYALEPLLDTPGLYVFGSNDYYGPRFKNPLTYLKRDTGIRIFGEKLNTEDLDARLQARGWRNLNTSKIRIEIKGVSIEARDLSDAEIITVLSREAKKRREAAEAFDQAGAKDRADQERAEGGIIAEYLPAQLSESEIKELIAAAIAETGANSPAQMGLVMKSLQPKTAGKADGGLVSSLVKAALAGGN